MSTEAKRPKLGGEGATADSENGAASALSHLGSFQMSRVLSESSEHKRVTMEGTMTTDGQKAIVILEKTPFNKETLGQVLSEDSRLRPQFINDIYGKYLCDLKPGMDYGDCDDKCTRSTSLIVSISSASLDLNFLKASVIHPATEKHVSKYESKPTYMIVETPALYHSVTLPFLKGETFSIEWVYNILSHKKEAETIVYENPDPEEGYILLPDYKVVQQLITNR